MSDERKKPEQMKVFSFTFYTNVQEDSVGRLAGREQGYKRADRLQIAFRGFISTDPPLHEGHRKLELVAHALYVRFNHPDMRPVGYRGPSMSIGDVVEIQGVHFAVERGAEFSEVEIWQSPIHAKDWRWTDATDPRCEDNILTMEPRA
jgi:hypothetical protein